jgi:hypothetical protein
MSFDPEIEVLRMDAASCDELPRLIAGVCFEGKAVDVAKIIRDYADEHEEVVHESHRELVWSEVDGVYQTLECVSAKITATGHLCCGCARDVPRLRLSFREHSEQRYPAGREPFQSDPEHLDFSVDRQTQGDRVMQFSAIPEQPWPEGSGLRAALVRAGRAMTLNYFTSRHHGVQFECRSYRPSNEIQTVIVTHSESPQYHVFRLDLQRDEFRKIKTVLDRIVVHQAPKRPAQPEGNGQGAAEPEPAPAAQSTQPDPNARPQPSPSRA